MAARVERAVISGVFSLDGQDFDVDNNVWLVGDDDEVLVIDAPHRAEPIVEAIGGRRVAGIVLTHGHNDHLTAAVALREAVDAVAADLRPSATQLLWISDIYVFVVAGLLTLLASLLFEMPGGTAAWWAVYPRFAELPASALAGAAALCGAGVGWAGWTAGKRPGTAEALAA